MLVFGIILTLIGVLLIVAFIFSRAKCKTKVEATVSQLNEKTVSLRGSTIREYTPVFTYTVNGQVFTYTADMSTKNRGRFTVGQREYIFVDINDPTNARYGSNAGFFAAGLVSAAVGIFFIVLWFM